MSENRPREWTVEFEDGSVTITDYTGRGKPFPLLTDNLTLETLLALSWYVATTPEEQCELRLLQLLGRYLFEVIFPRRRDNEIDPDLTARRERFRGQCESPPGIRLNLRFGQAEARYAQLPWEFLRLETHTGHNFLADLQGVSVTLTRFLSTQMELSQCDPPIKILVHVSEPKDKPEISYTGLEAELEKLRQKAGGKLDLRFRKDASLDEIRDDLKDYKPHVFHFSGHGEHDGFWLANRSLASAQKDLEVVGMSRLPFGFSRNVDTEVFRANIDAICGLFKVHQPHLIVLDACTSDWSWLSEMLPGVAHQLVTLVPAVVAMRYPISNRAAEAFSLELYRGVVAGQPLDRAVQAARNELRPVERSEWSSRAFGTPVLYMKGGAALCEPLVEVEEAADHGADRRPAQAKPCPRCGCPGLFTSTASKCTNCGVPFRCKNEKCRVRYTREQIAHLKYCCNDECDATYLDLPPLDEIGQPSTQAPAGDGASRPSPQPIVGQDDLRPLRQRGFALSSTGPGDSKLGLGPDPPGFDSVHGGDTGEEPP
jgi:hypothetical protein